MNTRCLLLIASLAVAMPNVAFETIIIDQGYDNQTKIAIVPFGTSDPGGDAGIADIIAFDLQRSGQFDTLESENMLSLPTRPDQVFFRDWRILGTEYVVIGRLQRETNNDLANDVLDRRSINAHRVSHRCSLA